MTAPALRRGWLPACVARLHALGQAHRAPLLRAFGAAELPPPDGDGSLYERAIEGGAFGAERLSARVVEDLAQEVDRPQAMLFARRFRDASALIAGLSIPAAAVYRVALHFRVDEVLRAPRPRALRVRAVVDYWYSQSAALFHERSGAPTLETLAHRATWRVVQPGIETADIAGFGQTGPVRAFALRLAPHIELEMADLRSEGGDLLQAAHARGAVAAVSGGYFLYSEPDIELPSRRGDPVSLLVSDGAVLQPPVFRRASLLWSSARGAWIAPVGLDDARICIGAGAPLPRLGGDLEVVTRARGERDAACRSAVVVVGDRVVAVQPGRAEVPLAGFVLQSRLPGPLDTVRVGDRVRYELTGAGAGGTEAMAGGPFLLSEREPVLDLGAEDFSRSAPPITFSADETFDQNLLPRMAAGLDEHGHLLFVAVEGRDFHRAPGLTLRQTAALLRGLGAKRGMNLDGGSSKRMIVAGRQVDRSTTEVVGSAGQLGPVRAVHSAIFVLG